MILTFPHKPQSHGGPGSFQLRLEALLKEKGWHIEYGNSEVRPDIVMVVGGTKKLFWLREKKQQGIPVICRLDGINWLHKKSDVSYKKWFISEARNMIFRTIRAGFADHVVYQSRFVEQWWSNTGWKTNARSSVIHNGVDLEEFGHSKQNEPISLLCVEGHLDYSPYAVDLLNTIQKKLIETRGFHSLILYGGFEKEENMQKLDGNIDYRGKVPREELPGVYRNTVYLSLDVHAACPNTVIEALASGIPVIGFDTGALKELVGDKGGIIVPYGSDPWELGFPDVDALCDAAITVKNNWESYSNQARRLAEQNYDINDVVQQYIDVIESEIRREQPS